MLADVLLSGRYQIVHFGGHGAFDDGRGYVRLNGPAGEADWVDGQALWQLSANYRTLRLVVLNSCGSGQVDTGRAFQGLAPQMVRRGVPAVVVMQFPLADQAASIFSREFYRHLCAGEDAGQVEAAVTYARAVLAVRCPGDRGFAAPVLYTHVSDGVIFTLPTQSDDRLAASAADEPLRAAALTHSLQTSKAFVDDWGMAGRNDLLAWRQLLQQTEAAYHNYLDGHGPGLQEMAHLGLALTRDCLAALDARLATTR